MRAASLPLAEQSRIWSAGLSALAGAIALCWLGYRRREITSRSEASVAGSVGIADRLRWIAYSFVPSSLLLAVTAYITTDLAAAQKAAQSTASCRVRATRALTCTAAAGSRSRMS